MPRFTQSFRGRLWTFFAFVALTVFLAAPRSRGGEEQNVRERIDSALTDMQNIRREANLNQEEIKKMGTRVLEA